MATYNTLQTCGTFDSLFHESILALDVLHILENDLEIYEKVSLVFLLYDDVHIAQQALSLTLKAQEGGNSTELTYMNLLQPWACSYGKFWREKLVEGLLIIQAFSNIKKLGLQLEPLNDHFLPKCSETSTFIHPIKKMLYKICESLTIDSTTMLIETVVTDEKCPHFKTDENDKKFLELFLLKLIEIKYITIGSWKPSMISEEIKIKTPSRMENLVSVLKKLRLGAHWSNLNDSEKLVNTDLKTTEVNHNSPGPSTTNACNNALENVIPSVKQLLSYLSEHKSRDVYEIIDKDNMGIALIINQTDFDKTKGGNSSLTLEDREGSNVDKDKLFEVWKMYGFEPIVYKNLNHKEILIKIKYVIDNHTKPTDSAFVLCILSHGEEGTVFGSDNIPVEVRSIEKLFYTATNLIGKPKNIIIQACQGKRQMKIVYCPPTVSLSSPTLKTDGPSLLPSPSFLPERSDLFCYWATGPECISYRDTKSGSWFIQTFCFVLEKYGETEEFSNMCTRVNCIISNKRTDGTGQMPEIVTNCLRKDFYLRGRRH